MMPIPFLKVTTKTFRRSLDEDEDSDTISSSTTSRTDSSTTSGATTSTSPSSSLDTISDRNTQDRRGSTRKSSTSEVRDFRCERYNATPQHPNSVTGRSGQSGSSEATYKSTSYGSSPFPSTGVSDSDTASGTTETTTTSADTSVSGSRAIRGVAASSSSGFSLRVGSVDPSEVLDPRTGRNIFAQTEREMKLSPSPSSSSPAPPRADISAPGGIIHEKASLVISNGLNTARSSLKSGRTFHSATRGLKKVKTTARLAFKIGEAIVTKGVGAPVARWLAREFEAFHSFRARRRAERRSHTLDWFEDRAKTARQLKDMTRKEEQDKRRRLWRIHLKKERADAQARAFLDETQKEFKRMADLRLSSSLERERARDFFVSQNDEWQMQILTKQVEQDEQRLQQEKIDAKALKVKTGDERREAAANEYLAEYDRGEVMTQAALRMMRRSGFIAGVNAPPCDIREQPLETDTFLFLRLKAKPRNIGVFSTMEADAISPGNTERALRQRAVLSPPFESSEKNQEAQLRKNVSAKTTPRKTSSPPRPRLSSPLSSRSLPPGRPSLEQTLSLTKEASGSERPTLATSSRGPRIPKPSTETPKTNNKTSGRNKNGIAANRKIKGGQSRGKKKSSDAFEVDLLRFRGVEEIQGWKLGALGGESLAADVSHGACPRLIVLQVGWCALGDRGTRAMIRALSGGGGASGAGRTLQEFGLRGNAITASGGRSIGDALAAGVVPALRSLDLGANALRDEGGKSVAHHLLAGRGTWAYLVRLDLSGNGMGDSGVGAICKAVTAPGVTLAPGVERISLRNNFVSRDGRRFLSSRTPSFLIM